MLLSLCLSAIRPLLVGKSPSLRLPDVPSFARDVLGLNGLTLSTDLLKGSTQSDLEHLRDRADKAACSCLLLTEPDPLPFGAEDYDLGTTAVDRATRVLRAAQVLGCNSAAVSIAGKDSDDVFDRAIDRLREAVEYAERLEVNLLIAPAKGLTATSDRVTDLIKRVGGFRVGTLPDFMTAVATGDPVTYLRRLTPYAAVVIASTLEFTDPPEAPDDAPLNLDELMAEPLAVHSAFDLDPLVGAVISVGFDITLGLDYRGKGDPVEGLLSSRAAIEDAVERALEKG
jgi:sugar phosphate isomerase/epimerase